MPDHPKILIVDDLQDNLQLIFNCLFNGGYLNILCARNGRDALDVIQKEMPDLIILDWDMPGMNGIEVLKKLQADHKTSLIPVIFATGAMLGSKDLELALNNGASDYIRKPFEGVELIARVKSALDFSSMLKTIHGQKQQIEKQKATLEVNERRLKGFLNVSNEACIFVEGDIITEANQLFCEYTGYIMEEVVKHSFYKFFAQKDRKTLTEIESMDQNLLTVSLLTKKGSSLKVEMIIKQFEYGDKFIQALSFFNLNKFTKLMDNECASELMVQKRKADELSEEISNIKEEKKDLLHQLQFLSLQQASSSEFIKTLAEKLQSHSKSIPEEQSRLRSELLSFIQEIRLQQKEGSWSEFKLRFADIHSGFYDHLLAEFPSLTENDLRLCALIRLKLSSKEIAQVINLSPNTIKVSRKRLRNKLQMENKSEALSNMLLRY